MSDAGQLEQCNISAHTEVNRRRKSISGGQPRARDSVPASIMYECANCSYVTSSKW